MELVTCLYESSSYNYFTLTCLQDFLTSVLIKALLHKNNLSSKQPVYYQNNYSSSIT